MVDDGFTRNLSSSMIDDLTIVTTHIPAVEVRPAVSLDKRRLKLRSASKWRSLLKYLERKVRRSNSLEGRPSIWWPSHNGRLRYQP